MKVSVIVPTYNRKIWLKACLESLVYQEFPKDEFEIIVIDDGSTDGTRQLMKQLIAKQNFKHLHYYYQKHQGSAVARNSGISKAKNAIIACIDDDEIASSNWLSKIISKLESQAMDGVGGLIRVFKPQKIIERYFDICLLNGKNTVGISEGLPATIPSGNCAFRKKILFEIGLFDPSVGLEDADLSWRLFFSGYKLAYVLDAITFHRYQGFLNSIRKMFIYGMNIAQLTFKQRKNLDKKNVRMKKPALSLMKELVSLVHGARQVPGAYKAIPHQYRKGFMIYILLPFLNFLYFRTYRLGVLYWSFMNQNEQ